MHTCSHCTKVYTQRSHLTRHLKKGHQVEILRPVKMKCPSCLQSFVNNESFCRHLEAMHDFVPRQEKMKFKTFIEFEDWKNRFEKEDKSKFRVRTSGYGTTHYRCHRSGKPRTLAEDSRQRKLKVQGSCKTNFHCPAMITAKVLKDGSIDVVVVKSHFGHEKNLAHLPIPTSEKKLVAEKLVANLSFDRILDEVQGSSQNADELERVQLLTKQDLRNIRTQFGLENPHSLEDVSLSVDAWVNIEKEKGVESSVLYYKAIGETCGDYPQLKDSDFCLVIMTPGQKVELERYGRDLVCLDVSRSSSEYSYQVTTLLVLNDRGEAFPCAYYISNRNDRSGLKVFFRNVNNHVGDIHPKVLMTDVSQDLYDSWTSVMSGCQKHVYCIWHVLRDWGERTTKDITNQAKREFISKRLLVILQETDPKAFMVKLPLIVKGLLSDPDTREFGEYFGKNYVNNANRWAFCYPLYSGSDANMSLEKIHGEFVHVLLQGGKSNSLDVIIHALIKIANQQLFLETQLLDKGQITSKMKQIRKSHLDSIKLDENKVENISDVNWAVCGPNSTYRYIVTEMKMNPCQCKLVCVPCNICIHKYTCTCLDCSVNFNICKHIHLVHRFLDKTNALVEQASITDLDYFPALSELMDGKNTKIEASPKTPQGIVDSDKKALVDYFKSLVDNCNTVEEVAVVKIKLTNAWDTIKSARKNSPRFLICHEENMMTIAPQQKFIIFQTNLISPVKPAEPPFDEQMDIGMPVNTFPEYDFLTASDLQDDVAEEIVIES